ncbi:DUF4145 domain-containing protein [Streptomyces griseorubiginosus]|uniref:DUF4145 domain-containing protein n=1 Tax=Streptomyces griseorubiginosus TaxID=67304 RepID=UPI003406A417
MTNRFAKLDGSNPLHTTVAGECPHCVRHTTLTVNSHSPLNGSFRERTDRRIVRCLMTLACDWCAKESVYLRLADVVTSMHAGGEIRQSYTTIDIDQVWPARTPRELAPEAPETVRAVFAEAALAEAAGAFRLAGIGYRATVEQIVKERGAVGKNLYESITELKNLGVAEEIVDAFHEARFVGNDSAHDALAYSVEEIADIAELIDEAVLVLYVQPAQRANMAAQRAARRAAAKQPTP